MMERKYLYTDWMMDFRCVGAECPKTCCGKWKIELKEEEIEKYKELAQSHPFGKKILEALDEENGCMRQCDGRCVMLTEEGWCRIVLECGEEYLSGTCTTFPRMIQEFGDVLECMVEIVCPIVAEYLFRSKRIGFCLDEIDDGTEEVPEQIDVGLYDVLSLARSSLMDLFQEYDASCNAGKVYVLFSAIQAIKEMHGKGELGRQRMQDWLAQWDEKNFAAVLGAVEPIMKREELKAVQILKLVQLLISSEALEYLLVDLDGIALKEDIFRWSQDLHGFKDKLHEFCHWRDGRYALAMENYFVYALFREWIPHHLNMDRFGKTFFIRIVMWCVIQLCALSVWEEKGDVTVREYGMFVMGLERALSHSEPILDELARVLENEESTAMILLYLV